MFNGAPDAYSISLSGRHWYRQTRWSERWGTVFRVRNAERPKKFSGAANAFVECHRNGVTAIVQGIPAGVRRIAIRGGPVVCRARYEGARGRGSRRRRTWSSKDHGCRHWHRTVVRQVVRAIVSCGSRSPDNCRQVSVRPGQGPVSGGERGAQGATVASAPGATVTSTPDSRRPLTVTA